MLDSFADDILDEAAQPGETGSATLSGLSDIDIKRRDIGGAGFQHSRAVDLGQRRHRPVDFLVDLDEQVVYVGAVVESEFYDTGTILRAADHVGKGIDLHKLLSKRFQYVFIQFAG